MGKQFISLVGATLMVLSLALAGCGKKEEPAPPLPAPAPAVPEAPAGGAPGETGVAPAGGETAPAEKKAEETKTK
jgi:hypothetical protein